MEDSYHTSAPQSMHSSSAFSAYRDLEHQYLSFGFIGPFEPWHFRHRPATLSPVPISSHQLTHTHGSFFNCALEFASVLLNEGRRISLLIDQAFFWP